MYGCPSSSSLPLLPHAHTLTFLNHSIPTSLRESLSVSLTISTHTQNKKRFLYLFNNLYTHTKQKESSCAQIISKLSQEKSCASSPFIRQQQELLMEEEVGLALGLSIGSGHQQLRERPLPCALEPSLSLSLPADDGSLVAQPMRPLLAGVKRELRDEEEDEAADRALYSVSSAAAAADDDEGCNSRKKLRLTKEQSALLEERFKEHSTLNPKQKVALAKQLNLRPRQVEVWFQNRRARTKLKQTEVDCELLKRCCETLTEENRRLHRELQQLRAINNPHTAAFFMPATALSICPSCERLTGDPAAAAVADRPKAAGPGRASHLFNPFTKSAAC